MTGRFDSKVALVTGATTGIGQATAVRLAAEGALVGVNTRTTDDPSETLRRAEEAGGEAFPVVADMRDPNADTAMVKEVAQHGGRLNYVVSSAAINPSTPWDEIRIEDFTELFDLVPSCFAQNGTMIRCAVPQTGSLISHQLSARSGELFCEPRQDVLTIAGPAAPFAKAWCG